MRLLQFKREGAANLSIEEWDIETATLPSYFADHKALVDFVSHGNGDLRAIARAIRPVLEGWCKHTCPNQFVGKTMLGRMIGMIQEIGEGHPLHRNHEELDAINNFSKKISS